MLGAPLGAALGEDNVSAGAAPPPPPPAEQILGRRIQPWEKRLTLRQAEGEEGLEIHRVPFKGLYPSPLDGADQAADEASLSAQAARLALARELARLRAEEEVLLLLMAEA